MTFAKFRNSEKKSRIDARANSHTNSRINAHAFENAIYSWRAPEYIQHEKSALWFSLAGIFAVLLVVYGIATGAWTMSLAVAVLSGTYYLAHRHAPPVVDVKMSKIGVKIGRHIFPYSHIKGFWIVYDPPFVKKLYFQMTSKLHPHVTVLLEDADPAEVKHALAAHVNEIKGQGEPFSDVLTRFFKL